MIATEKTRQCGDLLRRRSNLEDSIRRDRRSIEQLDARIRRTEIELADLRAQNQGPDVALPDIERDPDGRNPRVKPVSWLRDQAQEVLEWATQRRERDQKIQILSGRMARLRYERDQSRRLMNDSIAGKARLLQEMRRVGCSAAGTTNY